MFNVRFRRSERERERERERETQGRVTTLLCEIGSIGNGALGFVGSGTVSKINGREGWIDGEGLGVTDWVRA